MVSPLFCADIVDWHFCFLPVLWLFADNIGPRHDVHFRKGFPVWYFQPLFPVHAWPG